MPAIRGQHNRRVDQYIPVDNQRLEHEIQFNRLVKPVKIIRMFTYAELKPTRSNRYWRKALLGARLIIRKQEGKETERDRRLGRWLLDDPGVENRRLDQAMVMMTSFHLERTENRRETT